MTDPKPGSGIEYDPAKDRANRHKHRVGFDDAARIWEGPVFEWQDRRFDYGEQRFIALGLVDRRVVVVVYTWRGPRRRLISARKANRHEQQIYRTALADFGGQA